MNLLQKAKRFRHVPLIGTIAESFMFSRLALFFELAVNFIDVSLNSQTIRSIEGSYIR